MENINLIIKLYKDALDIPNHKLAYILEHSFELLSGCYGSINQYNVPVSNVSFKIFYRMVEQKLVFGEDIEYEWSENQYNNLMNLKTLH